MAAKLYLILCLCLLISGCASDSLVNDVFVLDTSRSLAKIKDVIRIVCHHKGKEFSENSLDGSALKMVVFEDSGQPYPCQTLFRYSLRLAPPTCLARKKEAVKLNQEFDNAIPNLRQVEGTPLLETIKFESALSERENYNLTVVSDLMQSTRQLNLTPSYLANHCDREIIDRMLEICPPAKNPPAKITVYWYPGLVKKDKAIDVELHRRIRSIFRRFFQEWAGISVGLEFVPIKEV